MPMPLCVQAKKNHRFIGVVFWGDRELGWPFCWTQNDWMQGRQKKIHTKKTGTIQFKAKRPTILANNMVITAARNTCTQCVLLALDSRVDDGKQKKYNDNDNDGIMMKWN